MPLLEHSALWWAVSVSVASSAQASQKGQKRSEQSPPWKPEAHEHFEYLSQMPFPLQLFGHDASANSNTQAAKATKSATVDAGAIVASRELVARGSKSQQFLSVGLAVCS
jgi:hypothetical protein